MSTNTKRGTMTVAALLLGGAAVMWAQAKTEEAGGSLAALTAEVKQLRVTIEQAAQTQSQTQALGVYLSAQQSRMVQLSAQLDKVRSELAVADTTSRQAASRVASAQTDMVSADAEERKQAAEMLPMFKEWADVSADALQNLRNRESDMAQTMRIEEQRWADLIGRLEQSLRK